MTLVWGQPQGGLRLGIDGEHASAARIALENVGDAPLEVLSHVEAGERHYDWFTLVLDGVRELTLADDRNRSARVTVSLAAGESLEHTVELTDWAARAINGAAPLAPGTYAVSARYTVSADGVWNGRLEAGPVQLLVP